jgi:hypothetical protein
MQMLLRILACRSLAHQVRSCGGGCGGASTLRGVGLVRVRGARVEALVGARLAHVGVGARGKLGTVGIMNTSRARASKHDPSPSEGATPSSLPNPNWSEAPLANTSVTTAP